MRGRTVLKVLMLALAGLMMLPVAASATWPGGNGKIFFACVPTGGSTTGQDICSINPDGSGFANLTNSPAVRDAVPDVSRDGSQVAFTQGTAPSIRVWAMNADGSNAHQVTTIESDGPSWTPDGNISYRANLGSATYEFQTIASTGGAATPLPATGVNGQAFAPRFNTSGAWIFAKPAPIPPDNTTFSQQIYAMNGAVETQLTFGAVGEYGNDQPSWSPDGASVLFGHLVGNNDDIWRVPSAGGAPTNLTNTAYPLRETWGSFSPDGSKLIFDRYNPTDANNDVFHKQIVVANADGSAPSPISTPALKSATNPVWAPSGSVTPPPVPIASFDATAPKKVKKGKTIPVTLNCTGDTQCEVAYGATVTVPGKGKKAKTFQTKTKGATMLAKSTRSVTLALSSSAKKAVAKSLKAGKKPTVKVTATAKQPNNGPQIRKVTLTVKITK